VGDRRLDIGRRLVEVGFGVDTGTSYFVSPMSKDECLQRIVELLGDAPAKCQIIDAGDGEGPPILEVTIEEPSGRGAALEVCRRLRQGSPPIYVGHGKLHEDKLVVHPLCLTAQDAETVGRRLLEELRPLS